MDGTKQTENGTADFQEEKSDKHAAERLFLRYLFFSVGIFINSFGIVFITKGALGTSQISSIPYVLSLRFTQFTFGETSFFCNMLYLLLQWALLKKNFEKIQLLQIAVNVVFSAFIDLSMGLLGGLAPVGIWMRLLSVLFGCAIMGVGIAVEVAPGVLTVSGEGAVKAISIVSGKRFGSVKVAFDVTVIAIAAALSLLIFGRLNGVGIGTVLSALLVGRLVNLSNAKLPFIRKIAALREN